MSNQEILTKAIHKATDGGWKPESRLQTFAMTKLIGTQIVEITDSYKDLYFVESIIFNHEFAKALWGEEMVKEYHSVNVCCSQPAYAYHLQQMVIAPDAIEYLGEHL